MPRIRGKINSFFSLSSDLVRGGLFRSAIGPDYIMLFSFHKSLERICSKYRVSIDQSPEILAKRR